MDIQQQYELIDYIIIICLIFIICLVTIAVCFDTKVKRWVVSFLYKRAPFYRAHMLLFNLAMELDIDDNSVKDYLAFYGANDTNDKNVSLSKQQYIDMLHAQRLVKKYYDFTLKDLSNVERLTQGAKFKLEVLAHVNECSGRDIKDDHEKLASRAN